MTEPAPDPETTPEPTVEVPATLVVSQSALKELFAEQPAPEEVADTPDE